MWGGFYSLFSLDIHHLQSWPSFKICPRIYLHLFYQNGNMNWWIVLCNRPLFLWTCLFRFCFECFVSMCEGNSSKCWSKTKPRSPDLLSQQRWPLTWEGQFPTHNRPELCWNPEPKASHSSGHLSYPFSLYSSFIPPELQWIVLECA